MIMELRNAVFFENIFPCKERKEESSHKRIREPSNEPPNVDELRRSKRTRTTKTFGLDFLTFMLENKPRTISEALCSPKAPFGKEAMNSKIESIM